MARRQSSDSGGGGSWMDTYGDMVTLLLTFFVLLFSFSSVDAQKWEELVKSFTGSRYSDQQLDEFGTMNFFDMPTPEGAFGTDNLPGNTGFEREQGGGGEASGEAGSEPTEGNGGAVGKNGGTEGTFNELYETVSEYISSNGLGDKLHVELADMNQILLRLGEKALFDPGNADIKKESLEMLVQVCKILDRFDPLISQVVVEGHTDSVPMKGGRYGTNRRLSNERALQVVEYIENNTGIEHKKLSSTGKGENWPIASNDTAEDRARNRRVDIIIYGSLTD